MEVETFEQTELLAGKEEVECTQEQIDLINQLGLEGQKKLINKDEETDEENVCPYRLMTDREQSIYEKLFSRKIKLEEYSAGPIPLRVLQVAAHAKTLPDVIIGVSVWYEPTTADKDPLLVGNTAKWNEFFLLARWGDALRPFEELAKEAGRRIKQETINKLEEIKTQVVARLNTIKEESSDNFVGRTLPSYFPK